MENLNTLVLCSSRLAIPTIQSLVFSQQLKTIVVPESATEMIDRLKEALVHYDLPVVTVTRKNFKQVLTEIIENRKIHMALVLSFPYLIPASILSIPPKGFFNIHPGPLPAYRGRDPVFHQIKNLEPIIGVSLHKMDAGFDTGELVLQEKIRLRNTDTYGMVTSQLAELAARQVMILLKLFQLNVSIPSRPQDEANASYYAFKGLPETCIVWQTMSAAAIIGLINACNPWNKGAITSINGRVLRILEASPVSDIIEVNFYSEPGTIIKEMNDGLLVRCINNEYLIIHSVYLDEGYVLAKRLINLGIAPGNKFDDLPNKPI